MLARSPILARPVALLQSRIDLEALKATLSSKRAQFCFAQLLMVVGYAPMIFNPLEPGAMFLGLLCQAVALLLYVSSKGRVEQSV